MSEKMIPKPNLKQQNIKDGQKRKSKRKFRTNE